MDHGQDQMNRSTCDIIAPSLVEVAKWLCSQLLCAVLDAGILLIGASATLLDDRAETLCCGSLDLHVAVVDSRRDLGPGLQIGNPGLVVFDFTSVVEFPERDLHGYTSVLKQRGIDHERLSCLREGSCRRATVELTSLADLTGTEIDQGCRNIWTARDEVDDLSVVESGPGRIALRCWSEREEILNRILKAHEISHGRDAALRIL